jgi:hypothetical protein
MQSEAPQIDEICEIEKIISETFQRLEFSHLKLLTCLFASPRRYSTSGYVALPRHCILMQYILLLRELKHIFTSFGT